MRNEGIELQGRGVRHCVYVEDWAGEMGWQKVLNLPRENRILHGQT